MVVAGGGYLITSIVVWANVLPHFASVTTCGCGDAALTLWVIKWPAYALSHGLNPFYSSKLFVPRGINMTPNSLGLGIAAAPITWIFGPVAALNLIDLLSPALSALAMFWLLRRWTSWAPAAFVGGLFFGFSPFVLVSLALGHPNFGLLAAVPLILGCLDELFVRRRRPPVMIGAALGLLVVIQFFVSVEVLALLVLFAVLAAIGVVVRAVVLRRTEAAARALRLAMPGLAAAGVVAAGAARLSPLVLLRRPRSSGGSSLARFACRHGSQPACRLRQRLRRARPDQHHAPLRWLPGTRSSAVLLPRRRHDHRPGHGCSHLRTVTGECSGSASWGWSPSCCRSASSPATWSPWRLFVHLPVLVNVVPGEHHFDHRHLCGHRAGRHRGPHA